MQVKASLKNYRKSARKVREVVNPLKGVGVEEAAAQLMVWRKGSCEDLLKLLRSAVANAKNNFKLNEEDLYISEIKVNEGMTMKRWRARAYGRAAKIMKRTCHVDLILGVSESKKEKEPQKDFGKSGKAEREATDEKKKETGNKAQDEKKAIEKSKEKKTVSDKAKKSSDGKKDDKNEVNAKKV
ncbi:MAG: 50S ribosomal protein L22 [Patescibacteria group bacterium]